MRKVAIVTTFGMWDQGYSLTTVVEQQLKMLVENGYEPVLITQDTFPECPVNGVTVRPAMPSFEWRDITNPNLAPGEREKIDKIKQALEDCLSDVDIAITHDFMLQGWFHLHGLAVLEANVSCRWYHQIHSVPSNPLIALPDGHDLIYLNYTDQIFCAERYQTMPSRVHVVYNTVEPQSHGITSEGDMARGMTGFMEAGIRITYPLSATRMAEKGVKKLAKLAKAINDNGAICKVMICDAHATNERERKAAQSIVDEYEGIMHFTSLLDSDWEYGFPNDAVRDMFRHSNCFVFPTISENNSLVLLEAMDAGNFLVLNGSFQPLKEFGGMAALYPKFGSAREVISCPHQEVDRCDPCEDVFYDDHARLIIDMIDSGYGEIAQKRFDLLFTRQWIWENQFGPLIEESIITPKMGVV